MLQVVAALSGVIQSLDKCNPTDDLIQYHLLRLELKTIGPNSADRRLYHNTLWQFGSMILDFESSLVVNRITDGSDRVVQKTLKFHT